MKTLLIVMFATASLGVVAGEWKQLPTLPDKEGFAGSFAGVSHGALLVAGGANFPGKKPWEGGAKVWYDTVFVLENPRAKWKVAGRLFRPLGYGASVTYNDELICVGGSNSERHYSDVFRLEWRNGSLLTTSLSPLPKPIANCCGALVGDVLYVAGGLEKPDSQETSKHFWQIDFHAASPGWTELETWPGSGRMLAVAAGFEDAFWLIGGVDLSARNDGHAQRRYLTDAYRYDARKGWKRIAVLPYSVVAAPSPAPVDKNGIYLLGGDDGVQAAARQEKHRGFRNSALLYDQASKQWTQTGKIAAPRATLPCVFWNNGWVLPGGEVRPGIRSPEVWSWTPGTME
jgi:N-acetylneuraminic acid mutarotase